MLKEVGASGQISIGKRYAGQMFEVDFQKDGSIVMRPVKVVPVALDLAEPVPRSPASRDAAGKPATQAWADEHANEIDQYNAWAGERETYSQRVRRWRKSGGA